jgi:hypothetical protein
VGKGGLWVFFFWKEGRDFFSQAGNFYGENPLGRGGGAEVFEGV